jgi:hypothetical protein
MNRPGLFQENNCPHCPNTGPRAIGLASSKSPALQQAGEPVFYVAIKEAEELLGFDEGYLKKMLI